MSQFVDQQAEESEHDDESIASDIDEPARKRAKKQKRKRIKHVFVNTLA